MDVESGMKVLTHPIISDVDRACCSVAQPISARPHIIGCVEDLMVSHGKDQKCIKLVVSLFNIGVNR